jgi:hypothetical protein
LPGTGLQLDVRPCLRHLQQHRPDALHQPPRQPELDFRGPVEENPHQEAVFLGMEFNGYALEVHVDNITRKRALKKNDARGPCVRGYRDSVPRTRLENRGAAERQCENAACPQLADCFSSAHTA